MQPEPDAHEQHLRNKKWPHASAGHHLGGQQPLSCNAGDVEAGCRERKRSGREPGCWKIDAAMPRDWHGRHAMRYLRCFPG